MIAYLSGKLLKRDSTLVIVEANGIGYEAHISLNTFAEIKNSETARLFTYLHIREDAHVLYGFVTESEKTMFEHLIAVNGVGPATALLALSYMPHYELRAAILREDVAALQTIKGVGGKTAQRIILELKDKLRKDASSSEASSIMVPQASMRQEAVAALVMLGINKLTAEKNVDAILKKTSTTSLEELIKQALRNS